jgi:intracellular sulfur oxidation DsrE/DsrF family protein
MSPQPFVSLSNYLLFMKAFIMLAMAVLPILVTAQNKAAKIVFDITSKDTLAHQTVIRHVKGMSEAYPDAQLEVVVYGGALPMLMTDKSTEAKKIQELAKNKNISFRACEGTMKRYNVTKNQLLPGVATVPDAIMEIVQKQGEGWGYIKEVAN